MRPLILITTSRVPQASPLRQMQNIVCGTDVDYAGSISRAGGVPLMLPLVDDMAAVRRAVDVCDGIVLTGGGDVLSLAFGEEPHPASSYHDQLRDDVEFEVTRLALDLGLPILAICRGIQMLNVALGGSLVQDVPTQIPGALKHISESLTVRLHTADVEDGSLLARVLGTTSLTVNSSHHQAVRDLGRGLRVNCRARDGVIEGVESAEGLPVLGVQFHPEKLAAEHAQFAALFDWVVSASRVRATSSVG